MMKDVIAQLQNQIDSVGREMDRERIAFEVSSVDGINSLAPSGPGIYWIETTMPKDKLASAISALTGKKRETRKTKPDGVGLIEQNGDAFYVAYSGTEDNIRKRLRQHLFNEGSATTVKLGCKITQPPFSDFKWRVAFVEIESYEIRYALEAWWRLKIGWPAFCRR